jgi:hypothetical protein
VEPWGEVSSFRDKNTVFEGQQINGQTDRREDTERRDTEQITEERSKE